MPTGSLHFPDADEREVHREQVRLLFSGFGLSVAATLGNAALLAAVLWSVVEPVWILSWLAGLALVSAYRTGVVCAYRRWGVQLEPTHWRRLFVVGAFFAGASWGAASFMLFPVESSAHQAFLAFVLAGMGAGGVATLSAAWCAALAYVLPLLLPLALRLFLTGESMSAAMAVMVLLFVGTLLVSARRIHRSILENIAARLEKAAREETLQRSQAFLAQTGQLADVGGWEMDAETKRLRWTDQTFRIHGVSVGATPSLAQATQFFAPEARPVVEEAVRAALETGEAFELELPLLRADGARRWIRTLGRATVEGGRVTRLQGAVQDITARKVLDDEHRTGLHALQQLHEITSTPGLSFDKRVARLLALGCDMFGLPLGIVSRINGDNYRVKHVRSPDGGLEPGMSFSLGDTYCADTLKADAPMAFHHAAESELRTHPCYQQFGLEAYIGCPIMVDGERYGTLNFSSPEPRLPFGDSEVSMIRLFAQWIGTELAREKSTQDLNRFKHVLDNTIDMIFMFEPESLRFVYLNEGAVASMGYSRDELLQMTPYQIKPEYSEAQFRRAIAPLLSGEQALLPFETIHRRKDGSDFPVAISLQFVPDSAGSGLFIAIVQDISERHAAEREREQQHRLLDVISRTQSRFIRDADHRALFDELLSDLLGLTESEYGFIGEVLYQGDGQPYLKTHALTNIAWNAQTREFYEEHAPGGLEFRNLDTLFGAALKTGQPVIANDPLSDPRSGGLPEGHPALNAFMGVPFFAGTRMVGMAGVANRPGGYDPDLIAFLWPLLSTLGHIIEALRNDEQRRVAEAAAEESATRIRAILDTVADGIITVTEEGFVESFNPAAERIFGFEADQVVGRHMNRLLPESYDRVELRHMLGTGHEIEGRRHDGSTFPMELSVSELDLEGRRHYTGILRDITERKKIERLKDEFVSTVSHELRTPLTSIRGSLGLLSGGAVGDLTTRARGLLEIAHNNSDRLIVLINDLLDMEKIASGKLDFAFAVQSLMPLVEEAIAANRPYAEQYQVSYSITACARYEQVNVDRDRFLQVMSNLLSNAAKFSPPEGQVAIAVSTVDSLARVSVSDNGPGIPEEFQARIFEKFSQADSSSTRERGGTGLGLAISKNLVEKMGGRIGFDTQAGMGTTFYFELPVWQAERQRETA